MFYYKPVKVITNILSFLKVIINVVIRHHGILNLIIIDKNLLFTLKF